jgi:hypothetical protein
MAISYSKTSNVLLVGLLHKRAFSHTGPIQFKFRNMQVCERKFFSLNLELQNSIFISSSDATML